MSRWSTAPESLKILRTGGTVVPECSIVDSYIDLEALSRISIALLREVELTENMNLTMRIRPSWNDPPGSVENLVV